MQHDFVDFVSNISQYTLCLCPVVIGSQKFWSAWPLVQTQFDGLTLS